MTYDIHIEGIPEEQVSGANFLTFGPYAKTVGVRGIHKLVSRFLKCFMTPIGTDLSDEEYGTTLMASFLGNVDSKDLISLASRAVGEATDTLQRYDVEYELEDSERLDSAELEDVIIDTDAASVEWRIRIQNAEGTALLVPVSVVEANNT